MASDARAVCSICTRQFSKYDCPRCNIRYCSLDCYKRHGDDCTNSFYQEQLGSELKATKVTDDARKRMMDALARQHKSSEQGQPIEPQSEEEEEEDTVLRELQYLALEGKEISVDALGPAKKKQFLRAVQTGQLSKHIQPWEPWWNPPALHSGNHSNNTVIKPLVGVVELCDPGDGHKKNNDNDDGNDSDNSDHRIEEQDDDKDDEGGNSIHRQRQTWLQRCPPLPSSAVLSTSISALSKMQPSKKIYSNVVQLLYAYCYTMKLYNGELSQEGDYGEAVSTMLSLCPVLLEGAVYDTPAAAVRSSVQLSLQFVFAKVSLAFSLAVVRDVAQVLAFHSSVVRALCHWHSITSQLAAAVAAVPKSPSSTLPKTSKKTKDKNRLDSRSKQTNGQVVAEEGGKRTASGMSLAEMRQLRLLEKEAGEEHFSHSGPQRECTTVLVRTPAESTAAAPSLTTKAQAAEARKRKKRERANQKLLKDKKLAAFQHKLYFFLVWATDKQTDQEPQQLEKTFSLVETVFDASAEGSDSSERKRSLFALSGEVEVVWRQMSQQQENQKQVDMHNKEAERLDLLTPQPQELRSAAPKVSVLD